MTRAALLLGAYIAIALFLGVSHSGDAAVAQQATTQPPAQSAKSVTGGGGSVYDNFVSRAKTGSVERKAIYTKDQRFEPSDLPSLTQSMKLNNLQVNGLKQAFRAATLVVHKEQIRSSNGKHTLRTYPYDAVVRKGAELKRYRVCSGTGGEKYHAQEVASGCSGSLVAIGEEQFVVTAGHCFDATAVTDYRVVFGYMASMGQQVKEFTDDQVYTVTKSKAFRCDRSPNQKSINVNSDQDFAVLKLDRNIPAAVAAPLKLAEDSEIRAGKKLIVVGYPYGLPLKFAISDGSVEGKGELLKVYPSVFGAYLDHFQGNSGAPVVREEAPNEIVGILTRGPEDFQFDKNNNCAQPIVYGEAEDCKAVGDCYLSIATPVNLVRNALAVTTPADTFGKCGDKN